VGHGLTEIDRNYVSRDHRQDVGPPDDWTDGGTSLGQSLGQTIRHFSKTMYKWRTPQIKVTKIASLEILHLWLKL
jgi:hypothetical protein